MKNLSLIGPISPPISGPGVKNKYLIEELERNNYKVDEINTLNWKKNIFKLLNIIMKDKNKKVILAISKKGRFIFLPFLYLKKRIIKGFDYILIPAGGAFYNEIVGVNSLFKKILIKSLKQAKCILVESHKLKKELNSLGLDNIEYLPNFKPIKSIKSIDTKNRYKKTIPTKFVFLSRVRRIKGIEVALTAFSELILENPEFKDVMTFDIYGPIEKGYETEFLNLLKKYNFARYKGKVEMNAVVDTLKNYDVFLFPTYSKTEGFPGVLIDAFSAGLPVIATEICSNGEIVINGENGYLIKPNSSGDLKDTLKLICREFKTLEGISRNNLVKVEKYDVVNAVKIVLKSLK
ncbi:glycosyltransferase family 4 protein [Alkalihalobacillus sp. TS-13]|uniref:glycosyltransferase family 4 protein n=1 Tax=Alkalihalobacillus sp. TS-13 TaxID=2842455 RepID=UPI001C87074B|nr:glycosyltransferase family 4 protein [Alkalihalobacillus sp. TS-13]